MRHDLRALDADALAVLSNPGLVKRAGKEIAAGMGPTVCELPDGTVSGRFPDGVESTLPVGTTLRDAHCTCGASSICRHRIATVLAYLESQPGQDSATSDPGPVAVNEEPDDEELRRHLGPAMFSRAMKLRPLARADLSSDGVVHLDTCSVRFLSGQRLAFAHCDCRAAGPCEHLALAIWALQGRLDHHKTVARIDLRALDMALEAVREVIEQGVTTLGLGLSTRFQESRRQMESAGMVWPVQLIQEIEGELEQYRKRGGRYRVDHLACCVASLWARRQVCLRAPDKAAAALGLNLVPETSLRQLRLTGLGCRMEQGRVDYFLADPTSGQVLVLPARPGQRPGGISPLTLASGHLVTASAYRTANGGLRLGRGAPGQSTICRNWDHLVSLQGPPGFHDRLLGECRAGGDLRIVVVDSLLGVHFSPGQQELSLQVLSREGLNVRLALGYRSATPFALECLYEASDGLHAAAGIMGREGSGWHMRPTALLTERGVLVPDLAESGRLEDVPLGQACHLPEPLLQNLEQAVAVWEEVVHRGLAAPSRRISSVAAGLRRVGMPRTAAHLEAARDAEDWLRLACRLEVARQLLG